jgi:hypothetical protein
LNKPDQSSTHGWNSRHSISIIWMEIERQM